MVPGHIARTVKQAVEIWNYVDRMAEDRVELSPTAGGVAARQEDGDQAALLRDKQKWPWAQVGRAPVLDCLLVTLSTPSLLSCLPLQVVLDFPRIHLLPSRQHNARPHPTLNPHLRPPAAFCECI